MAARGLRLPGARGAESFENQRGGLLVCAPGLDRVAHQAGGRQILRRMSAPRVLWYDVIEGRVLRRYGAPAVAATPSVAFEQRLSPFWVTEVIGFRRRDVGLGFEALPNARNLARGTNGVRRPEPVGIAGSDEPRELKRLELVGDVPVAPAAGTGPLAQCVRDRSLPDSYACRSENSAAPQEQHVDRELVWRQQWQDQVAEVLEEWCGMFDTVSQLVATEIALIKIGVRGISPATDPTTWSLVTGRDWTPASVC